MAHVRTQIRNKLVEILTGLDTTQNNVFVDYVYNINEKFLPCISIVTGRDNYERVTLGKPAILDVETDFSIYGAIKTSNYYQDLADQIILEVTKAINTDITLKEMVQGVFINSVNVKNEGEFDEPIAFIEIFLTIKYKIREDDPEHFI